MGRDLEIFRRLVRLLLPEEFRAGYETELSRTYRDQRRDAAVEGRFGLPRLWMETLLDLLRLAPRQHVDQLHQDLRHAARAMRRQPLFYTVAALVLAVGIAATTAIFSIVDAALLRPIPFEDPHRLVSIGELTPQDAQPWELSYPTYQELRLSTRSFEELAAWMLNGVVIGGPEPRLAEAALISSNLLATLRVHPLAGRSFTSTEDGAGGAAVALVGHTLARSRFGSADAAIGRALPIDGQPATIVGVLADDFRFPNGDVEVWLPIAGLSGQAFMQNRAVHVARAVARLRPESSPAAAQVELTAWMDALQAREPTADPGHRLYVRSLGAEASAQIRAAVSALGGAALLLLSVTCVSVGLLLLTRASARTTEMAVRLSLGATRARLTRQLLTEAACLVSAGTLAGVAAAPFVLAFLRSGLEDALPPLVDPSINLAALGAAAVAAAVCVAICGITPAAAALTLVRAPAVRARRSRHRLVFAQVAVCGVLLVLAALLGRSLDRLLRVDVGFRTDRLLLMRVGAPVAQRDFSRDDLVRFFQDVVARVSVLPGVTAVTAGAPPPLEAGGQGELRVEGQTVPGGPVATFRRVQPGYFDVLGIPLLEGRDFTDRDGRGEPVVIVSAGLARRFWPPDQAVGKRIKVGPADREPWLRIVGVVGDVRNQTLEAPPDLATYEPHAQRTWSALFVMVRTAGDAGSLTGAVPRAIRALEPQVLVSDVSTMEERIAGSVATRRFYTVVVATFAAATVLLVALAVYGALAYSVSSRLRELGIRAALGASPAGLRQFVLGEGFRPTLAGIAVGLAGGALAAVWVRTLLYEITPQDVWAYATSAGTLLLVAGLASWLPARRAAAIDASSVLKAE